MLTSCSQFALIIMCCCTWDGSLLNRFHTNQRPYLQIHIDGVLIQQLFEYGQQQTTDSVNICPLTEFEICLPSSPVGGKQWMQLAGAYNDCISHELEKNYDPPHSRMSLALKGCDDIG